MNQPTDDNQTCVHCGQPVGTNHKIDCEYGGTVSEAATAAGRAQAAQAISAAAQPVDLDAQPVLPGTPPPNLCSVHGVISPGHRCPAFKSPQVESWKFLKPGDAGTFKGVTMVLDVIEQEKLQLVFQITGFTDKSVRSLKLPNDVNIIRTELRKRIVPGDAERFVQLVGALVAALQTQGAGIQALAARQDQMVDTNNHMVRVFNQRIDQLGVSVFQTITTGEQPPLVLLDPLVRAADALFDSIEGVPPAVLDDLAGAREWATTMQAQAGVLRNALSDILETATQYKATLEQLGKRTGEHAAQAITTGQSIPKEQV